MDIDHCQFEIVIVDVLSFSLFFLVSMELDEEQK